MDVDREELRRRVYRAHSVLTPTPSGAVYKPACPWCGKPISNRSALHEWLVKRNRVPLDKQHLIMTVENCILADNVCHDRHGQTKEFRDKCLRQAVTAIGASRIGEWYHQLVSIQLTGLPKGLLLPRRKEHASRLPLYLFTGALLRGVTLPHDYADHPAIGPAIQAWKSHRADRPSMGLIKQGALIDCIEEGRWYEYLKGVCV